MLHAACIGWFAMDRRSVAALLEAWSLPAPTAVWAPDRGTNNLVRIVDAGGSRHVLRWHQNATTEQIEAEHRLLTTLVAARRLTFRVPEPIATVDGRWTVTTARGPVSLTSWIPGDHPARDRSGLELAGSALGELDLALAGLPLDLAPTDWSTRTLSEVHPLVTDVAELATALVAALPAEPAARWFAERAAAIETDAAHCYERLPRQIVHGDFALGNLLVHRGRVTGVLDFEIAGLDLRLTEVAAALTQSTDGLPADEVAAFARGYARHVRLTDAERAAGPTLIRYRALGSIIWRAGRWRAGHATLEEVADRLREGARLDAVADRVRFTE